MLEIKGLLPSFFLISFQSGFWIIIKKSKPRQSIGRKQTPSLTYVQNKKKKKGKGKAKILCCMVKYTMMARSFVLVSTCFKNNHTKENKRGSLF